MSKTVFGNKIVIYRKLHYYGGFCCNSITGVGCLLENKKIFQKQLETRKK